MNIFPQSQQAAQQGFQQALDVFSQTIPQQAQAFTSGNVAAQNALLAGLPSMQAAILGTPMPELNLQPFQYTPDLSFADQTLASIAARDAQAAQDQNSNTIVDQFGTGVNPSNLLGLQGLANYGLPTSGFNFSGGSTPSNMLTMDSLLPNINYKRY